MVEESYSLGSIAKGIGFARRLFGSHHHAVPTGNGGGRYRSGVFAMGMVVPGTPVIALILLCSGENEAVKGWRSPWVWLSPDNRFPTPWVSSQEGIPTNTLDGKYVVGWGSLHCCNHGRWLRLKFQCGVGWGCQER